MKNQTTEAYYYGAPIATGRYKAHPDDFVVTEDLGFELTGEGEHVFVQVRKRNANTLFVADLLAKFAQISPKLVSYAGLKDRNAVTTQWFNLHLPGKITLDFDQFQHEGIEILTSKRHNKKLKIGSLKGNAFELIVRDISNMDDVLQRLARIQHHGVPNYFGEQRFGREGNNLVQALAWANGEIAVRDRKKRSFYLSAIRSYLFNQIVSQRIEQGLFDRAMVGDIVQLSGSHSWFTVEASAFAEIEPRLSTHDVTLTAPLMGDNGVLTSAEAAQFEMDCLEALEATAYLQLLKKERLETSRRSVLSLPEQLQWQVLDDRTLSMTFWLPSGHYATSVLRECFIDANTFIDTNR